MLSDPQKASLLRVARKAVVRCVTGQDDAVDPSEAFPEASGVFVTIRRGSELRGCMGTLQCREGLGREVARCARDSATKDPRFPPVSPDEISDLSLEISVLGPFEEIDPLNADVVVGRDGLLVEQGARRGLLLPQVATEWGWTAEQFLGQTCRKAELPEDAWRTGAQVFRFEADVFGE